MKALGWGRIIQISSAVATGPLAVGRSIGSQGGSAERDGEPRPRIGRFGNHGRYDSAGLVVTAGTERHFKPAAKRAIGGRQPGTAFRRLRHANASSSRSVGLRRHRIGEHLLFCVVRWPGTRCDAHRWRPSDRPRKITTTRCSGCLAQIDDAPDIASDLRSFRDESPRLDEDWQSPSGLGQHGPKIDFGPSGTVGANAAG